MDTDTITALGKVADAIESLSKLDDARSELVRLHVERIDGELAEIRDGLVEQDEKLAELRDELRRHKEDTRRRHVAHLKHTHKLSEVDGELLDVIHTVFDRE